MKKIRFLLLTFGAILAMAVLGAALDSQDIDEVCSNDNSFLYRYGGNWGCGILNMSQFNISYHITNITEVTINNTNGTITFNTSDYVPYTGALQNVNLATKQLTNASIINSTNAYITGRLGVGTSPAAALHVVNTTGPQMRIEYNGSNYLTASMASNGVATLDVVGNTGTTPRISLNDELWVNSQVVNVKGTFGPNEEHGFYYTTSGMSNKALYRQNGITIIPDYGQGNTVSNWIRGLNARMVFNHLVNDSAIPEVSAMVFTIENRGSGNITTANGIWVELTGYISGNGTITDAYGIRSAFSPINTSVRNIAYGITSYGWRGINAYGLHTRNINSTTGTAAGILIENSITSVSGSAFAIKSDSTAKSSFAGNITAPTLNSSLVTTNNITVGNYSIAGDVFRVNKGLSGLIINATRISATGLSSLNLFSVVDINLNASGSARYTASDHTFTGDITAPSVYLNYLEGNSDYMQSSTVEGLLTTGSLDVNNDLNVYGKITAWGGIDPPYLSLTPQNYSGFLQRIADEVPPAYIEEQTYLLYKDSQLLVYNATTGEFKDTTGKTIYTQTVPSSQTVFKNKYIFDAETGDTKQITYREPKHKLNKDIIIDPSTGDFINKTTGERISKSKAVIS